MTFLSLWVDQVKAAENSGDLFVAYDLATQGLAEHPDSIDLRYLATRALARSSATDQAAAAYAKFDLGRSDNGDVAALGARLAKDQALAARTDRAKALRAAARAYAKVFAVNGEYYPAVNAATLYLLAGERKQARAYARLALTASERSPDGDEMEPYYRAATRSEVALVLGEPEAAREALQAAAAHLHGNFTAAATTRKQLRLICDATGASKDLLDLIHPPVVMQYYGPALVTKRFVGGAECEREFRESAAAHLAQNTIGYVYGSLSAGADIVCAEACLRANLELNVVLPFREDEFVDRMVRPAGPAWVRRFRACLGGAKSVTFATTDSYQGDESLFTYACRLAMGMAILRAQHLDSRAEHLRLAADGWQPDLAGYDASLKTWQRQGRASGKVAQAPPIATARRPKLPRPKHALPPRFPRAVLFGDVKGFSKTPDYLIPVFQKRLMGTIAATLRRFGGHVLYQNSWGDAIYVVIDDPVIAANCSLAIQEALKKKDFSTFGLSRDLALRLAAHFGPVYDGHDPICDEPTFFGAHTTIAARMEPVTVPGEVYVTEAMAAALALAGRHRLRTEYVGRVPMAKGFGSTRMYALARV